MNANQDKNIQFVLSLKMVFVILFLTHTHSFVFFISYHSFVFTVIKYVLYYMPLLSIDQYQKLPKGCIICVSTTFRAFTRNSEGFDLNMKSNISLFLAILKPFPFWHSKMSLNKYSKTLFLTSSINLNLIIG